MEYTIATPTSNTFTVTIGTSGYTAAMTVTKIIYTTYVEETQTVSVSPTITPVAGVYSLTGVSGDDYTITLSGDGVYKIYITENSIDYVHIFINVTALDTYFKSIVPNLICCNPVDACTCGTNCGDYYNFNVLFLLSFCYFGANNIEIAFNYGIITSGYLYNNYEYECINIGSGLYDWKEGATVLLQSSNGENVSSTSVLTLNAIYSCIETGIPDGYGSVTPTQLTGLTTTLENKLNYIADAFSRVEDYQDVCVDNNACIC